MAKVKDSDQFQSTVLYSNWVTRVSIFLIEPHGTSRYSNFYPFPTRCFLPLISWRENEATEIWRVCNKVLEQAIAHLEEARYERNIMQDMKIIGAPSGF